MVIAEGMVPISNVILGFSLRLENKQTDIIPKCGIASTVWHPNYLNPHHWNDICDTISTIK